jgi:hypothetical protein
MGALIIHVLDVYALHFSYDFWSVWKFLAIASLIWSCIILGQVRIALNDDGGDI